MLIGNPMTLKSQIAVAFVSVLGITFITFLLHKRKINELLFYLWLIVFVGVIIVGVSHRIQIMLTKFIGAYSPISTMLLLALSFLFGASLVYSVMISKINTNILDITSYIAEIRLDLDEIMENTSSSEMTDFDKNIAGKKD